MTDHDNITMTDIESAHPQETCPIEEELPESTITGDQQHRSGWYCLCMTMALYVINVVAILLHSGIGVGVTIVYSVPLALLGTVELAWMCLLLKALVAPHQVFHECHPVNENTTAGGDDTDTRDDVTITTELENEDNNKNTPEQTTLTTRTKDLHVMMRCFVVLYFVSVILSARYILLDNVEPSLFPIRPETLPLFLMMAFLVGLVALVVAAHVVYGVCYIVEYVRGTVRR